MFTSSSTKPFDSRMLRVSKVDGKGLCERPMERDKRAFFFRLLNAPS